MTWAALTRREQQVLYLIARGFTVKQVCAELRIARKTTYKYVERIGQKFGTRGQLEMVRHAVGHGLVTVETFVGPSAPLLGKP